MTAPSKSFTAIADTAVDPDSPLDTALMTALRDNDIHLKEVLYGAFTPSAPHTHNGVDSALVEIGPNAIRNGSFENGSESWTLTPYTGGTIVVGLNADTDGANALAITSTVLANGGGVAESDEYVPCIGGREYNFSLTVSSSLAGISGKAEVIWYDADQSQISVSSLYSSSSVPTSASFVGLLVAAPSSARFYRVRLTGGIPATGSSVGTIYFDSIVAHGLFNGTSAKAAATCTYTGSLVESSGIDFVRTSPGTLTYDLGSNRVVTGLRQYVDASIATHYLRGYNLRNN